MARYHPPEIITNNAAPVLSADLAYEAHGKCSDTVVLSNLDAASAYFSSVGEIDKNHAWKVVFLNRTKVILFEATNMTTLRADLLGSAGNPVTYEPGVEIMADITKLRIDERAETGLAILYRNCNQS